MKETIKQYFPLLLATLCATYAIFIIFHSISEISQIFGDISQKDNKSLVAQSLSTKLEEDIPLPIYALNSLTVGEGYIFETLFELESPDGSRFPIGTDPNIALYLVDVKTANKNSILTRLSSASIESLDQLPSTAIYDTDQHLLYFHNSGIYTLLIRLYYNHRPGILFECLVPVEVR